MPQPVPVCRTEVTFQGMFIAPMLLWHHIKGGIIVFAIILKAASLADATLRAASTDCVQWEGTGRDKK